MKPDLLKVTACVAGLLLANSEPVAAAGVPVSEGCQKYVDTRTPPEVLVACPLSRTNRAVEPEPSSAGYRFVFEPGDRTCRARFRWPQPSLGNQLDVRNRVDDLMVVTAGRVLSRDITLTGRGRFEAWINGAALPQEGNLHLELPDPGSLCWGHTSIAFRSAVARQLPLPSQGSTTRTPLGKPSNPIQPKRGLPPQQSVQVQPAETARQTYTVPGLQAWSTAKTYRFRFMPSRLVCRRTTTTAQPRTRIVGERDGVDTQLRNEPNRQLVYAAVVGGNMVLYPATRGCTVHFSMFQHNELAPGWSIKQIELSGSYRWRRQPAYGTRNMGFEAEVTWPDAFSGQNRHVIVREVVLEGPPNRNWQEAFGAP